MSWNFFKKENGATIMYYAIKENDFDMLQALIKHQPNILNEFMTDAQDVSCAKKHLLALGLWLSCYWLSISDRFAHLFHRLGRADQQRLLEAPHALYWRIQSLQTSETSTARSEHADLSRNVISALRHSKRFGQTYYQGSIELQVLLKRTGHA